MKQLLTGALVAFALACLSIPDTSAEELIPFYSIDAASPVIERPNNADEPPDNREPQDNITPDDVLTTGPTVFINGESLGLEDNFYGGRFDNLDALSFGLERIPDRPPAMPSIFFSVDRVAVGSTETDVNREARPGREDAAGDIFEAAPPSNSLAIDVKRLGLTSGFFGDDVDALALLDGPNRYFSIENDSTIFFNSVVSEPFATGRELGLTTNDDIDALMLYDASEQGVLNPGRDRALFSLSSFSTSVDLSARDGIGPGDILFTEFNNEFSVWLSAGEVGLRHDDELDALATPVPEPESEILALSMLIALVLTLIVRQRVRFKKLTSRR